ncbi:CocE/NonD family hydrolase [Thalassotalea fonticola]|uniref:CocE/NonD family hydrolase n=1 Tax=Thalassotalea fonticola TaxID=3065649 RepID=A0ABZ0GSA7_9GAMM|nr:CocE/NonD family hydrolase [Colwelliaceae bacterium S1-1]
MNNKLYLKICRFTLVTVSVICCNIAFAYSQFYDGWQRNSVYVDARDGVKLAVDYYRPTFNGELHQKPLPVAWRFTPYGRFLLDEKGKLNSELLPSQGGDINGPVAIEKLLESGYIVAVVDVRGYSASHGVSKTWLGEQQAKDAFDITEWLIKLPFTTEKTAMFGRSYLGSVQYLAAAEASPYLKAIFPAMAQFDHYETAYSNGIYRQDLGAMWQRLIRAKLDFPSMQATPFSVAPVDNDSDRRLITKAAFYHQWNRSFSDQMLALPFRDSIDQVSGEALHIQNSPAYKLTAINASNIAIYHWTGWWDAYGKGQTIMYANLTTPQKLHIGPYFHVEHFGIDVFDEMIKWFDFHLKGIENNIMDEEPVRYFVVGDSPEDGWKTSKSWPLDAEKRQKLFFSKAKSGSINSTNDSSLAATNDRENSQDDYDVDYSISLGGYIERNGGSHRTCKGKQFVEEVCYAHSGYPDLSLNYDQKSLTYTSEKLTSDIVIVGHPVVQFWLTASTDVADLFVVLEEVEPDGTSRFVTDNALKTSHKAVTKNAPFNNLGLPWLANLEKDRVSLSKAPNLIQLDLKPIGNRFDKGNRIRVTIAGADSKSGTAPWDEIERKITIHKGSSFPSFIDLPVIEGSVSEIK